MMLKHIRDLKESQTERAYRVGSYLEEFKIQPCFKENLASLMKELRAKPEIRKYVEAQAEMYKLVDRFFATDVMDYRNNNCPPALTKKANQIAAKYPDLRITKVIEEMGKGTEIP
jgi:hypothetical protein